MTRFHFVGIKGSGMSSLAQILHDAGHRVQGSDVEKYFFTEEPLRERNIPIAPFQAENIEEDMTVIAGNAFPDEHEEIVRAEEMGIPVIRYHHFLGDYMKAATSISVTGTHGKTSTTGLLSHVLSGAKPTSFLIGDGTGKGVKDASYFVFEACEYKRHFLSYHPDYTIVTNVDFDHPDYFEDLDDVLDAFNEMAGQVSKGIIACGDDENLQRLHANVPIVYYGFDPMNDFYAKNIEKTEEGSSFDVFIRNEFYHRFTIRSAGDHAILNALGVIALCQYEEIEASIIQDGFDTFGGVKRRFSVTSYGEHIVVDDYAHHPTEIRVTIESARQKFPDKRVVAIFQPHTFTRTAALLDEFATSLERADDVYICDIFGSAREDRGTLTVHDVVDAVEGAHYLPFEASNELVKHGEAVYLFMGAGDIPRYANELKSTLQKRTNLC